MELPVGSGPVVGCLDKTLKEHKVQRQATMGKLSSETMSTSVAKYVYVSGVPPIKL